MFNQFTKLCVRATLILAMMATASFAEETLLPKKDVAGSSDSPALKRYRIPVGSNEPTSLMMYFIHANKLDGEYKDALECAALPTQINDQRFFAASFPQGGADAYVSVLNYRIAGNLSDDCTRYTNHSITIVNIVEAEKREQKMITVNAREMATAPDISGRVALYGIFFDTDRTGIKPESDAALAEIAKLLKSDQDLNVLIVGHTDDVGNFDYNVDLSKRRAASITRTLADRYGIAIGRLRSFGAGMSAPAASNTGEEGRSQNRRVELVKMR